MRIVSRLRKQKALSLGLLAATLAIGILIGTIVNTGVKADPEQRVATDATPLIIPSPVQLPNEFTKLVADIEPAVVFIQCEEARQGDSGDEQEMELFRKFFGGPGPEATLPRRTATGSGFLVDSKGYIITNFHVVQDAEAIKVKLVGDQTEHKAKLIGVDGETDLAVIKIDAAKPTPFVKIGNSDAVQVGDWAVAIGSPFGLEASVTAGIVSAKERDINTQQFQRFIQTDAAINPGNSGGPLVNIRGEVVGVNTMIATRNGGYQGIGFALPVNMAVKVYNSIIRNGRVTRGTIGVKYNPDEKMTKTLLEAYGLNHGVVVSDVPAGGPAAKAGIQVEDVLLALDGKAIRNGDDLVARIADAPVGSEVKISVDRDGKRLEIPVTIGDRAKVWENEPRFSYYRQPREPKPEEAEHAKFGIYVKNLSERERDDLDITDGSGAVVTSVEPNSFAEEIGLQEKDVIVSINRKPVKSVDDIRRLQASISSGDAVAFRILRPVPNSSGGVTASTQYIVGHLP